MTSASLPVRVQFMAAQAGDAQVLGVEARVG